MSLELASPAVMEIFDGLCRTIAARKRESSMTQIGDAFTLAQELESGNPDGERVAMLAGRLGLDPGDEPRQIQRRRAS